MRGQSMESSDKIAHVWQVACFTSCRETEMYIAAVRNRKIQRAQVCGSKQGRRQHKTSKCLLMHIN